MRQKSSVRSRCWELNSLNRDLLLPPYIDPFNEPPLGLVVIRSLLDSVKPIMFLYWDIFWSDQPGPHSMTYTKQSQFMDCRCSSTSHWAPTALGLLWRPGRRHSHMTLPTSYNPSGQCNSHSCSVMTIVRFFFSLSINISIDATSHCCHSLATGTLNISSVLDKVGGRILSSHRLFQCLVLSQSLLLFRHPVVIG